MVKKKKVRMHVPWQRVRQIRQQLDDGTYDVEGKLEEAVEKMVREEEKNQETN